MSVSRKHGNYAIDLAGTIIGGQMRSALRTGTEVRVQSTDGIQYPVHQAIYAQEPVAELQTLSIAAALDEIGSTGLAVTNAAPVNLWAYKRAHGGTRAGALSHRKYVLNDGLIVPERISCDHRGDAQLDYRMDVTYDGTNEPLVVTDSQTVPAVAANNERFTLGPLTLGGVSFDHLTQATIEFGLNVTRESADSEIWPTHVSIDDIIAVLRFTGIDPEWLKAANIPFAGGLVTTHANGSFFLKKRDRSTTTQFAAGADHVKFTIDGLVHITDAFEASEQTAGTCKMDVPIVWDGTNAPIVATTGELLP